jgi:hypothetical protein
MSFRDSDIIGATDSGLPSRLAGWDIDRAKRRGAEKLGAVLDWVYRWGYASSATLVGASGAADRSYPQRLVRRGLIRPVPTTRCPTVRTIFVLTAEGLDAARAGSSLYLDYPELDSRRISQATVRHNLIAQREVLRRLPEYSGWRSDREFGQNLAEAKRPDGALVDQCGDLWGLEIELSGKWARRLDQMAIRIVAGIAQRTFAGFHVLCASAAMAERYRAVLAPGHQIQRWEPGPAGSSKFFPQGCWEPTPRWVSDSIHIEILKNP